VRGFTLPHALVVVVWPTSTFASGQCGSPTDVIGPPRHIPMGAGHTGEVPGQVDPMESAEYGERQARAWSRVSSAREEG